MKDDRAEMWREALKIPELMAMTIKDIRLKCLVCSRHFKKTDYKNNQSRSLNWNAVPSINLITFDDKNCNDSVTYDISNNETIISATKPTNTTKDTVVREPATIVEIVTKKLGSSSVPERRPVELNRSLKRSKVVPSTPVRMNQSAVVTVKAKDVHISSLTGSQRKRVLPIFRERPANNEIPLKRQRTGRIKNQTPSNNKTNTKTTTDNQNLITRIFENDLTGLRVASAKTDILGKLMIELGETGKLIEG